MRGAYDIIDLRTAYTLQNATPPCSVLSIPFLSFTSDLTELSRKSSFQKFRLSKENASILPLKRWIPWAESGSTPFQVFSKWAINLFSWFQQSILQSVFETMANSGMAPTVCWAQPTCYYYSASLDSPQEPCKTHSWPCIEVRKMKFKRPNVRAKLSSLYPKWCQRFPFPSL